MDINENINLYEDYVSYETAKLLKKNGFDSNEISCIKVFKGHTYKIQDNVIEADEDVTIPTIQMAMKWLREIHGIFIVINIVPNTTVTMEQRYYFFKPYKNRRIYNFPLDYSIQFYETYEQACEAGIRYCLENLI